MYQHRVDYVAGQLLDGIEWLEKVTGREFQDELFLEAAWNDIRSTYRWAEICMLNRTVPAPLRSEQRTSSGGRDAPISIVSVHGPPPP